MNQLLYVKELKNHYKMLRHGRSVGNVAHILVGNPDIGTVSYGLIGDGRKQSQATAEELRAMNGSDFDNWIIYSSDFLRARETAEIIRWKLGIRAFQLTPKLRERSFGKLEGGSDRRFKEFYHHDRTCANESYMGVESAASIQDRVTSLVRDLELFYSGKNILSVLS